MKLLVLAMGIGINLSLLGGWSRSAKAAIFLGEVIESSFVTPFGSGDILGSPDGGGLFLGDSFDPPDNQGSITAAFTTSITDGAGFDIEITEIFGTAEETADVFLSQDGLTYLFAGEINGLSTSLDIDFDSLGMDFANFIRVSSTSATQSLDIDSISGIYEFSNTQSIPENTSPIALTTTLLGFLALKSFSTKKTR